MIADDLWVVEARGIRGGIHLRLRMTVVRLATGGLWLHSSVPMDDRVVAELNALGPVEHLVAPNRWHHLHLAAAKRRFAGAKCWGAPGLAEKCKHLHFDAVLTDEIRPWDDTLVPICMRGFNPVSEVVFLHTPSRTLICTDLVFNILDESHWLTRLLWKIFGVWQRVAQNRAWRLFRSDQAAAAASAAKILAADFDRIIMAHGDVIESGGRELLAKAMDWMTPR